MFYIILGSMFLIATPLYGLLIIPQKPTKDRLMPNILESSRTMAETEPDEEVLPSFGQVVKGTFALIFTRKMMRLNL